MGIAYNPSIVTNGLVLCLDAANPKGYDSNENLLLYSEDFSNGNWQKQNGFSITSNTAIAPNETLTADTASRVNLSAEYLYQGYGVAGTFTLSCWVKTVTGTSTFNMLGYNGTDGTVGNIQYTATTTWQRFSTTATVTTSTGWYPCIPSTSNTQFYIWGAQLERGSSPSPYYATAGTIKNRGTTLIDLIGNGNNGTLTNGPTYNSANGGSLVFDGVNDGVQLSGTNLSLNQMTISSWNFSSNYAQNGFMFEKTTNGNVNTQYSLFYNNNNTIYYRTYGLSTIDLIINTTTGGVVNNQWNHIVATWDGTNKRIYVNGVLQTTTANLTGTITQNNTGNAYIGIYGNFAGYPFNGRISQTQIYNRALSAAEIQQNFNATRSRYSI